MPSKKSQMMKHFGRRKPTDFHRWLCLNMHLSDKTCSTMFMMFKTSRLVKGVIRRTISRRKMFTFPRCQTKCKLGSVSFFIAIVPWRWTSPFLVVWSSIGVPNKLLYLWQLYTLHLTSLVIWKLHKIETKIKFVLNNHEFEKMFDCKIFIPVATDYWLVVPK